MFDPSGTRQVCLFPLEHVNFVVIDHIKLVHSPFEHINIFFFVVAAQIFVLPLFSTSQFCIPRLNSSLACSFVEYVSF